MKVFQEGPITVTVKSEDEFGNKAEDSDIIIKDTTAGTITLNEISDNYINAIEKRAKSSNFRNNNRNKKMDKL